MEVKKTFHLLKLHLFCGGEGGMSHPRVCALQVLVCRAEDLTRAGIFNQSMGARNRVGMGLSYQPARLHSEAELVPWNRSILASSFVTVGWWHLTYRQMGCRATSLRASESSAAQVT